MSEMVERVARAICEASGLNPDHNYDPNQISRSDDVRWRLFIPHARAAIEALRDPTEDMANAAECAEPFSFEAMWKAAVDAALGEAAK